MSPRNPRSAPGHGAPRTPRSTAARRGRLYPLVGLVVFALVLVLLGAWVVKAVGGKVGSVGTPEDQCVVTVGATTSALDLEQSSNAAIIVGESIRRGLPARAASIALATAMQESRLHNITYGDRDSIGLFQQRPSQGWGTRAQIMDPWYSSGKFYDELVKVSGWQSGDLNDVAQKVQRSGVPDGYRAHVEAAKAWASALTGHSPAAVSCIDTSGGQTSSATGLSLVTKAFAGSVRATPGQAVVTLNSSDPQKLWAATQLFLASTSHTGVTRIVVGTQTWQADEKQLPTWQGAAPSKPTEATISLKV